MERAEAYRVRAEAYRVRAEAAKVRPEARRVRAEASRVRAEASRVSAGRFCVFVELGGRAVLVTAAPTDTIQKVTDTIKTVAATRWTKKVGGQLLENGRTLSDYDIQPLDTLVLTYGGLLEDRPGEAWAEEAGEGRARRRREAEREAEQGGRQSKQPRWEDVIEAAEEEEEEEEDWAEMAGSGRARMKLEAAREAEQEGRHVRVCVSPSP